MRLSVFTTITRPEHRGDNYDDAGRCYDDLADELIIIDGHGTWPREFSWPLIGEHFQRGYEACTGDWVIHADLDFIFHEKDFEAIRRACEDNADAPALSFWKYQFILPDRYNLKSRLVLAVNKGVYGDRIRFDSGGDLCQPSLDGKYIRPDDVPEAKVPFYNYEKLLKTKEQITDDVGRMARAWQHHFGEWKLGGPDDQSAYDIWLEMTKGRFSKPQAFVPLENHPKYVQETIKNLEPKNFGYNGFGELGVEKCYA